jgi:hypothetical protein
LAILLKSLIASTFQPRYLRIRLRRCQREYIPRLRSAFSVRRALDLREPFRTASSANLNSSRNGHHNSRYPWFRCVHSHHHHSLCTHRVRLDLLCRRRQYSVFNLSPARGLLLYSKCGIRKDNLLYSSNKPPTISMLRPQYPNHNPVHSNQLSSLGMVGSHRILSAW